MAGRPAASDAEKRQRGTFRPETSEAARAARREEKIVSLFGDVIECVPPAPAGLHPDAAREYQKWCEALRQAGRLTHLWVERVQLYAISRHNSLTALANGKSPRLDDMRIMQTVQRELGSINADTPITQGGLGAEGRKFAGIGFASRLRPPAAG